MLGEKDIMDAGQAAKFLGVHVQTIRRLARTNSIPCFKVGREWRFRKEALLRWADQQHVQLKDDNTCRVLVIDDQEGVRKLLIRQLTNLGYYTLEATDGKAGLESVKWEVPDLIFLDLKMSKMNGPTFLKKLRIDHPDLPVVIVTGYPDSELMRQAAEYPPILLLPKPVMSEQIERTIKPIFKGKR